MKSILAVLVLSSFSLSAFAGLDSYICRKGDQTVLLKKIQDLPDQEDWDFVARYNLQVQTTELPFPKVNVEGVARSADVHFFFKSDDKKISVRMYLDEDKGSTITINRKKEKLTNCKLFPKS